MFAVVVLTIELAQGIYLVGLRIMKESGFSFVSFDLITVLWSLRKF